MRIEDWLKKRIAKELVILLIRSTGYGNSNKLGVLKNSWYINPFHATVLFLYPLNTSKNERFSEVVRRYRKWPMAWNGLRSNWKTRVLNKRMIRIYRASKYAIVTTYSRQNFLGLSWMVKLYYIQNYPDNFRGNTVTRTITSDFIWLSIESSLTRRGKKTHIRHVVRAGGYLQVVNLNKVTK